MTLRPIERGTEPGPAEGSTQDPDALLDEAYRRRREPEALEILERVEALLAGRNEQDTMTLTLPYQRTTITES